MSARPLAASVALLALGYDERSAQANMQLVENTRRGSYVLITPENSDAPGTSTDASAQHEIHWCAEVKSKMGMVGCDQF